ncbi:MAG: glycosyltransferase family 2 protein [Firmicutes bacterium]|nr:glycosyltransferase family 2 protein [Bacillota bacterium]
MKKTISISIPTYNEEGNVLPLYDALREQLTALEDRYDYEIVFIDNKSTDSTREKLLQLCERDKRVKAIFNTRNFGASHSSYYGALQTSGDCTICMNADFQEPPELLPRMVEAWEQGHKSVCMVKAKSRENPLMRGLRTLFYRILRKMSDIGILENYTGFGLYDKCVLDAVCKLGDSDPFSRGLPIELGFDRIEIPYTQDKRRAGKSSYNFFSLYDHAMLGMVTYTKMAPRLATFMGLLISGGSFIAALVCLILSKQDTIPMLGLFFLGGVQLLFLGLLGEYIINIQRRSMGRPLVIEERRVNFDREA